MSTPLERFHIHDAEVVASVHAVACRDDRWLCTYDIERFSAGIAFDILRTHPMAIIGGLLQETRFTWLQTSFCWTSADERILVKLDRNAPHVVAEGPWPRRARELDRDNGRSDFSPVEQRRDLSHVQA